MVAKNDPPRVLAGVPVGAPGYTPGPGYEKIPCQHCGRLLWIGPRQRAIHRRAPDAKLLCMLCAIKLYGPPNQIASLSPDPGSKLDKAAMKQGLDAWLKEQGEKP